MITQTQKFRITLKSFNLKSLLTAGKIIKQTAQKTNSKIVGPIQIPTRQKRFCVLRSPHVDKDSREHFEIKIFKLIIDIYTNSSFVLDSLMRLSLPAGINIVVIKN